MAHKSKKKHIKHVHQHDQEGSQAKHPGAKATGAALGAETSHKVRLTTKAKEAARTAIKARAAKPAARKSSAAATAGSAGGSAGGSAAKPATKRRGIVRSLASAASEKLTAKPKRIISKARARVRSLLGRRPAGKAA